MRFLKAHWRIVFPVALAAMLFISIALSGMALLPDEFYFTPVSAEKEQEIIIEAEIEAIEQAVEGAVTILADGEPVCTLSSTDGAINLLNGMLEEGRAPEGETLLSAEFVKNIELRHAKPGEQPIEASEALELLSSGLCPVRVITRTAQTTTIPYEAEQTEDKRLRKSARLVLSMGLEGEETVINKYAYIDGIKEEAPVYSERSVFPPVTEEVAVGTYNSSKSEPGTKEGVKGPDAPEGFSLKAPCAGKITANFGMSGAVMNNGIDYALKVGEEITAPEAGTIVFARERGSYGFLVEIDHGDGFITRLAPVDRFELTLGDTVEKGQAIGVLAAPLYDDEEPILHMELLIGGIPYNPRQYLI